MAFCFTPLADLSGSPCTSQGLLESLSRVIDPSNWDAAVDETRRSVCVNHYADPLRPSAPDCGIKTFPDRDTVCQVFVAYMNLAYDRKIPEFTPGAHPTTGKGSAYWPSYEGSIVTDTVSRLTGTTLKLVQEIMFELYWATQTGRISDGRIAKPYTYRLHNDTLNTQPKGTDLDKNRSWLDFSLTDLIRWGLILGVVGVGVYAVSTVLTSGKAVAGLLKSS